MFGWRMRWRQGGLVDCRITWTIFGGAVVDGRVVVLTRVSEIILHTV